MAGEMQLRVDNHDPIHICHEIINMAFSSSETTYALKKRPKKRSLDRYDSSESSDSGVATLLHDLGSPLTPDSRGSEYSIPSPEVEPTMAPPPSIENSADEIDLTWPWNEWTVDCSNIELFSDPGSTVYCKTDSSIELNKSIIEDDNLSIFEDSTRINDLLNSLPLAKCKHNESSNMKTECDIIPTKKFLVSDEKSPTKFILPSDSEEDLYKDNNSVQYNILDDNSLLKDEITPLHRLEYDNNFNSATRQLLEDPVIKNNSVQIIKNKVEKSNDEKIIDVSSSVNVEPNNCSDFDNNSNEPVKKKLCVDQTLTLPKKGRYFMRSSSASPHDLFKSKYAHLLDLNKNVQGNLTPTKQKCSLRSPVNKRYSCDNNCSIKNNEQLNYSTSNVTSTDLNSDKIRFPKSESHWISLRGSVMCRWNECNSHFTATAKLLEHLQAKHVNSQTSGESFVCLWADCKVFNKSSCSRSWLERHVLSHGGNKPLQCIVQKCRQRFSSQIMLERHVNQHFKLNTKEDESINGKLIRRKGKKLRLRRQPFTARKFDYFDASTMMGLQTQLFLCTQNSQHNFINYSRRTIKFKPEVIAQRTLDENNKQELLIRWFPPEVLDDEWITCDKNTNLSSIERIVPIMSMNAENRNSINKLFGNIFPPPTRHSRK